MIATPSCETAGHIRGSKGVCIFCNEAMPYFPPTEWLDCKKVMPDVPRHYWLTDGKSIALGKWSIADMWWQFLWQNDVFKPTHMLPVKLPALPEVST